MNSIEMNIQLFKWFYFYFYFILFYFIFIIFLNNNIAKRFYNKCKEISKNDLKYKDFIYILVK